MDFSGCFDGCHGCCSYPKGGNWLSLLCKEERNGTFQCNTIPVPPTPYWESHWPKPPRSYDKAITVLVCSDQCAGKRGEVALQGHCGENRRFEELCLSVSWTPASMSAYSRPSGQQPGHKALLAPDRSVRPSTLSAAAAFFWSQKK